MLRIISFILVRLLAIAWILILTNVFEALGPYSVSIVVFISEGLFGYLWAKAETEVTMCMPGHEDPKLLAALMVATAAVEGVLAWLLLGSFAIWIIIWRAITAYVPFTIVEVLSYQRRCGKK
jgi:hypothetical protein